MHVHFVWTSTQAPMQAQIQARTRTQKAILASINVLDDFLLLLLSMEAKAIGFQVKKAVITFAAAMTGVHSQANIANKCLNPLTGPVQARPESKPELHTLRRSERPSSIIDQAGRILIQLLSSSARPFGGGGPIVFSLFTLSLLSALLVGFRQLWPVVELIKQR